ncbi:hypothetical protein FB480_101889 [Agrobacterium vitis]|nr:hypothetical protein FB480_101889 [Agrobacterium vitis]
MTDILYDVVAAFQFSWVWLTFVACGLIIGTLLHQNSKLRHQARDLRVKAATAEAALKYATGRPTKEQALEFLWHYEFSPSEIEARYPGWANFRDCLIENELAGQR